MCELSRCKISVAILAGGKSSRMGGSKLFAKIGEKYMIEYIYDKFKEFDDLFLVARENMQIGRTVQDIFFAGVIGGIATALLEARNKRVLVIGGDMPMVSLKPVKKMCSINGDIVIPVWINTGFLEPLFAIYSKNILPSIVYAIYNGIRSPTRFVHSIKHVAVPIEKWIQAGLFTKNFFLNVNTPEDLEKTRKLLKNLMHPT